MAFAAFRDFELEEGITLDSREGPIVAWSRPRLLRSRTEVALRLDFSELTAAAVQVSVQRAEEPATWVVRRAFDQSLPGSVLLPWHVEHAEYVRIHVELIGVGRAAVRGEPGGIP